MLIKLQEVEVNDDEAMIPANPLTSDISSLLTKEPKVEILEKMAFDQNLCQERYKHCSMVWFPGVSRQGNSNFFFGIIFVMN